jgi:hypothetical protein
LIFEAGGGFVMERNGTWYLRGIISTSSTSRTLCDGNSPALIEDSVNHIDWIMSNLNPPDRLLFVATADIAILLILLLLCFYYLKRKIKPQKSDTTAIDEDEVNNTSLLPLVQQDVKVETDQSVDHEVTVSDEESSNLPCDA